MSIKNPKTLTDWEQVFLLQKRMVFYTVPIWVCISLFFVVRWIVAIASSHTAYFVVNGQAMRSAAPDGSALVVHGELGIVDSGFVYKARVDENNVLRKRVYSDAEASDIVLALVVLAYASFTAVWASRPFHLQCVNCYKHLASNDQWRCGICHCFNDTVLNLFKVNIRGWYSFLSNCENCGKQPWGVVCPHCGDNFFEDEGYRRSLWASIPDRVGENKDIVDIVPGENDADIEEDADLRELEEFSNKDEMLIEWLREAEARINANPAYDEMTKRKMIDRRRRRVHNKLQETKR